MIRRYSEILVLVVSVLLFFSCDLITDDDSGYDFYLTEVSTSGSVGGLSVDYIELYNPNDEEIDLTGYYFGDSEGVSACHEVILPLSLNQWDSDNSEWTSTGTSTSDESYKIPANGYLIILFSNDFMIDDAVSNTLLISWIEDSVDQTVAAAFADTEYLTVPEGLKAGKAEAVYIYDPDGAQAANSFTYTADEQEEDTVFLYDDGLWEQGNPSPGESNV